MFAHYLFGFRKQMEKLEIYEAPASSFIKIIGVREFF